MRNFIQSGDTIPATAPSGGVLSGGGYKIGDLFGIASASAAEGKTFSLTVAGVFKMPKAAVVIAEGVKVYWAAGAGNVTTTASGNTLIGHAIGAAAEADATVNVRLSN